MCNHAAIVGYRRLEEIRVSFNGLGAGEMPSFEVGLADRIILTRGVEFLPS